MISPGRRWTGSWAMEDADLSLEELQALQALAIPQPYPPVGRPTEQLAYLLLTLAYMLLTRAIAENEHRE